MTPFGEYRPDLPALHGHARMARNVIPGPVSYRPFRSVVVKTNALPARVQGAFASSGTVAMFAGTDDALFRLTSGTWTDVSIAGGYATAGDGIWRFAQFGDLVIAVNGIDDPQKWVLGSATEFDDLGGSPPAAQEVAVVKDFVVLGNTATHAAEVRWSAIDDAEDWAASQATQSDAQILPDGGRVLGLVGGEYGLVMQETAIRRMTYVGAPLVFQFDKVEDRRGVLARGSIADFGPHSAFYLAADGFYRTDGNGPSAPIGANAVDRTILDDLDGNYLHRISATVDPVEKLYLCAYPGAGNDGGVPNRIAVFHWETARWSLAELDCELIWRARAEGTTLEEIASVWGFTDLDEVPYSLDSPIWQGGASVLGNFDLSHRAGHFTGPALEAVIDTAETQIFAGGRAGNSPGGRALVKAVTPLVDAAGVTVAVGARERQQDAPAWTAPVPVNRAGFAPLRATGRYHRARVTIPAGQDWSHAQGVDFEASTDGRQ